MVQSKIITTIYVLLLIAPFWSLNAKDTLHISSDKTAQINKPKGTLLLKKNVVIIQESSQSTLKTDELFVKRDATSDQLMKAVADGKVEILYRPVSAKSGTESEQDPIEPDKSKDVTLYCRWAAFDRPSGLIELRGSVVVKSVNYILEADHVKYYFESENGRFIALPGKQVRMTYFRQTIENNANVVSKKGRTKIQAIADLILFNKTYRKLTLQGNVHIVDTKDQSKMTTNRAELFFDVSNNLELMIANGNFTMDQPTRQSKSDRAVFEYGKEEITLTGNAFVKEENKIEITSSRIKMHIKAKKGIITGAEKVPVKMKITIE